MIITVEQLLNWGACHHEDTLRRWVGGGVTPLQVADLRCLSREIAYRDRLWVLLRPEIIPERELRLLACRWARRALRRERRAGREPDPRSWAVVEVAERFARGEATRGELIVARDDARDAAGYATGYAAGYAALQVAEEAALQVAEEAVLEVARVAAWEATEYAGRDAAAWAAGGEVARVAALQVAREAERRRQLEDVRATLRGRSRWSSSV